MGGWWSGATATRVREREGVASGHSLTVGVHCSVANLALYGGVGGVVWGAAPGLVSPTRGGDTLHACPNSTAFQRATTTSSTANTCSSLTFQSASWASGALECRADTQAAF